MKIILARELGFCFGVERAVCIALEELKTTKKIVTLGPLIHNPRFTKKLQGMGLSQIAELSELAPDTKVVIRSHGAEKKIYGELKGKNIEYIDATCPIVIKSQKIVENLKKKGIFTIIIGDPQHSEIKSIKSFACNDQILVSTDIEEILTITKNKNIKEVGVLAQTTLRYDFYESFCEKLKPHFKTIHVHKTICNATLHRQTAALELAKKSDIVLVIGGKKRQN